MLQQSKNTVRDCVGSCSLKLRLLMQPSTTELFIVIINSIKENSFLEINKILPE